MPFPPQPPTPSSLLVPAIMLARAEEAALAVVNARRDMASENEESVAKAVMAERRRLEAIQAAASQQATEEIGELKAKAEAQSLQEKEAVALWEEQEATLMRQLEEAENDLAEVTQAYPLALEEAKASLAAAHNLELQALQEEPQPEPEDTAHVNELLAEIEELKVKVEAQTQQEKAAIDLWEKQESLLTKQLQEAKQDLQVARETSAELESRSTAAVEEIADLKAQAGAQAVQEKEAVTLWEQQEAALMRQLEEAENDLAELTQAYPLALEEAKASLAEAHAHEMEVATGVSALVSAEPAPLAELADEGRIDELHAEIREKQEEIEELYEIHEQRSQQISALENDVLHIGRQLSQAETLNGTLQAELSEARTSNTADNVTETELRVALKEARAENEIMRIRLASLDEQDGTCNVQKLKVDLLKQGAEMTTAEEPHRKSLQKVLAAHAVELNALKDAHAVEVAAARNEAIKRSENAQTALMNVRTMLTPVKGNAGRAADNVTPGVGTSFPPQAAGRQNDDTAALKEREAAALQQVEELRARLEQMEKMQLPRTVDRDSNASSVARSRSSEMALNVRAMLSGVAVGTPARGTESRATSAEQLQDEYLERAVLAAEIARSNTPNTAKRKQDLLAPVGISTTPVDLTKHRPDDYDSAVERRQREAEIRSTLDAGMISPAEAEKMLLHHELEASLTPAKDIVHSPQAGSAPVKATSWDQLAHNLDDVLTDAHQNLPANADRADDDANADESNPFESSSGMVLESSAPVLAAENDSDPFKTSSDEDERPLSPVPEHEESLGMPSSDTPDSCEEDTVAVDGQDDQEASIASMDMPNSHNGHLRQETGTFTIEEQLDPFEEAAASAILSRMAVGMADARESDPFHTGSDEDSQFNILSPVLEDEVGENGSQSDLSLQSAVSLPEEHGPRASGATARVAPDSSTAAEKVHLVRNMQASLDEHSPIPASAYVTGSLIERMKEISASASSTVTADTLAQQRTKYARQEELPRSPDSVNVSMSSLLDGSSDDFLSESESGSTEDERVDVEVEEDV
eukprot:COSAG02_NODE_1268_length_13537_cov_14.243637_1_plen_1044_part_00